MKRDAHLRDLSVDHHHALVLGRRATRAIAEGKAECVAEVWRAARAAYLRELQPHFMVEERILLPALVKLGEHQLASQTLDEHQRLRTLIEGEAPSALKLAEFGKLLTDHVRFEERVLFAVAQRRLPPDVLAAIAKASRDLEHRDQW